jgi:anti-sigma regulatory factor (Ser/Thr protein kinase)
MTIASHHNAPKSVQVDTMDKEGNDRYAWPGCGENHDMTMFPSVHVCLPSDGRAARAARRSLLALADYLPSETIDDLKLLVSELVSNSVKHAASREDERITVDAEPVEHCLHVEVTNAGAAELTNKITPRAQESGWGLFIVTKVASRWGVTTDGSTSVWFEIDIDNAPFFMRA